MRRHYPLPFSPYADFVATRQLTLLGVAYEAGDQISKEGLSERQLLKLYETRKIAPKAFAGPAPTFFDNAEATKAAQLAEEAAARESADDNQPAKGRRRASRRTTQAAVN